MLRDACLEPLRGAAGGRELRCRVARTAASRAVQGFVAALLLLGCAGSPGVAAREHAFDLVILNGRVVDPASGLDAVRHIGIEDGKIAVVSEAPLEGADVVDASGLVVTAGFVDMHSHDLGLLGARYQAFDGVTTQLELEFGRYPVDAFYTAMSQRGHPLNYGAAVSWMGARAETLLGLEQDGSFSVLARSFLSPWGRDALADDALEELLARLRTDLEAGALGVGLIPAYGPGAGTHELLRIHQLASGMNVPVTVHVRYQSILEPDSSLEAFLEEIAYASASGAQVHLSHINLSGLRDVDSTLASIQAAQARGLRISTETYPYGITMPPASSATIAAEDVDARMGFDWGDVVNARTGRPVGSREGLLALIESEPATHVRIPFLDESDPADRAILERYVTFPGAVIASDSPPFADENGYLVDERDDVWPLPASARSSARNAGTFAGVLGRWVRERKVMTLMDALGRMSYLPARILEESIPAFAGKGRIAPGADADIVGFDPETVIDRATWEQPARLSEGFRFNLVHGEFVIRDGELRPDARPGRPIRRRQ
jgi:N-acyl-D-glutamate deacylase